MITPYQIPSEEFSAEFEVKRSRFIAVVRPVNSLKDMRSFFLEKREEHPKARHNCWGVVAGSPTNSNLFGFSDDGEPSGCAGKPILSVLGYSKIGQIGVVITRYFGGIKLGTGGMVKAYTESTKAVLEVTRTILFSPQVKIKCSFNYDKEPHFRSFISKQKISSSEYFYSANVNVEISINEVDLNNLKNEIALLFGVSVGVSDLL
jgi:uncharacterized YigZ family protein